MKLSTTSKSEALGNCNFPQIYSLGWFEATSTPTSLNTLSTFMIHEICRPQKKRMEKQKRIPESMIGGSNKFILVYLILSHNYTHDSSLLHQQLYMSFTPTGDHSTPTLGCYIHKRAGHGKEPWQLPWVWIIHWMLMSKRLQSPRFLPDSPARCQGTLAIGWEALACSSQGGFSSLDVPFQYSLALLKHVLRSLYIFDDYYIIIYILYTSVIARYVHNYISLYA